MRNRWFAWIGLVLILPLGADPRGVAQVEVRQGELARLFSSWRPSSDLEGRCWWAPDRGGSAWVKAGAIQVGPLTATSPLEGAKRWAPGTSLGSGTLGTALEVDWGSLWAVQTPGEFEVGVQGVGREGRGTLAAGIDRTWSLTGTGSGASWVDRARVGGSWKADAGKLRLQIDGSRTSQGTLQEGLHGQVSLGQGPWEASLGTDLSSQDPWNLTVTGGWRQGPVGLLAGWDRAQGWDGLGVVQILALGLTWGGRTEVLVDGREWTFRGGLSLAGRVAPSRWALNWSWNLEAGPLVQRVKASWKSPSFEVEVVWRVEGLPLGWVGAASRFDFLWRGLF